MKSPGVQISRHPTLAGWTHHAVYFDGVRVPKTMVLGEVNEGWKVITGALANERIMIGSSLMALLERAFERLASHVVADPRLVSSTPPATVSPPDLCESRHAVPG